ncbi:MAG: hypothetical protein M5U13_04845 [Thermoanaerobaculia bacterium]|nr:hypothetical protein [Thermoanaerobaculia bacterium]
MTVWRVAEGRWGSPVARGLAKLGLWWSARRWATALDVRRALGRLRELRLQAIEAPECGAEALRLPRWARRRLVVRFHSPAELIMPFYGTRAADRRLAAALERRGSGAPGPGAPPPASSRQRWRRGSASRGRSA